MSDQHADDITVTENPGEHRFDIQVDGTPAGISVYQDVGDPQQPQRIFHHTVIEDGFEGQGLAGILTRKALGASIDSGHRIVAVCPYVKKWLTTHHEFDAFVDEVRPQHLDAIR